MSSPSLTRTIEEVFEPVELIFGEPEKGFLVTGEFREVHVYSEHLEQISFQDIRVGDLVKCTLPKSVNYSNGDWDYRLIQSDLNGHRFSGLLYRNTNTTGEANISHSNGQVWTFERVNKNVATEVIKYLDKEIKLYYSNL